MNEKPEMPYVLVGPDGVRYLGLHDSEDGCWQIALGWPSAEEIAAKKAAGFRVHQATVSWKEQ